MGDDKECVSEFMMYEKMSRWDKEKHMYMRGEKNNKIKRTKIIFEVCYVGNNTTV